MNTPSPQECLYKGAFTPRWRVHITYNLKMNIQIYMKSFTQKWCGISHVLRAICHVTSVWKVLYFRVFIFKWHATCDMLPWCQSGPILLICKNEQLKITQGPWLHMSSYSLVSVTLYTLYLVFLLCKDGYWIAKKN